MIAHQRSAPHEVVQERCIVVLGGTGVLGVDKGDCLRDADEIADTVIESAAAAMADVGPGCGAIALGPPYPPAARTDTPRQLFNM